MTTSRVIYDDDDDDDKLGSVPHHIENLNNLVKLYVPLENHSGLKERLDNKIYNARDALENVRKSHKQFRRDKCKIAMKCVIEFLELSENEILLTNAHTRSYNVHDYCWFIRSLEYAFWHIERTDDGQKNASLCKAICDVSRLLFVLYKAINVIFVRISLADRMRVRDFMLAFNKCIERHMLLDHKCYTCLEWHNSIENVLDTLNECIISIDIWDGRNEFPLKLCDKSTYRGMWKDGLPDGDGILIRKHRDGMNRNDSYIYNGQWEGGKRNGKGRQIWLELGRTYDGEWCNNYCNGYGEMKWRNKSSYRGEFVENKRQGNGRYVSERDDTYEGMWYNDQRHGYGEYLGSDKMTYEGEWVENKRHGKGKYISIEGDSYQGEWSNDDINGIGNYIFVNGDIYKGEFSNNYMKGMGVLCYSNGDVYNGEFVEDFPNGFGCMEYATGARYEGDFVSGLLSGKGSLYDPEDRGVFHGEFMCGKKNGLGQELDADGGVVLEGMWRNDEYIGFNFELDTLVENANLQYVARTTKNEVECVVERLVELMVERVVDDPVNINMISEHNRLKALKDDLIKKNIDLDAKIAKLDKIEMQKSSELQSKTAKLGYRLDGDDDSASVETVDARVDEGDEALESRRLIFEEYVASILGEESGCDDEYCDFCNHCRTAPVISSRIKSDIFFGYDFYVGQQNEINECHGYGKLSIFYEMDLLNAEYNGIWKEGKKNGFGDLYRYDKNGNMILHYSGKWLHDLRDGHGIEINNGEVWEGEWYDDNKNGVFRHTFADGRYETMRYMNGKPPPLSKCQRKYAISKADDASVHRILENIDNNWYVSRDEENERMRNERMLFLAQELINRKFPFSISVIDLGNIAVRLEEQYKSQKVAERELLAYEKKKSEEREAKKAKTAERLARQNAERQRLNKERSDNKRERLEREREERNKLKNERREKARLERERVEAERERANAEQERLIIEKAKQDEAAALKNEHETSMREAQEERDREFKIAQYTEANNVLELENKSVKFGSLEKSRKIADLKREISVLEGELTLDARKVAENNHIISFNNEQVAKIDKKLCIVCFYSPIEIILDCNKLDHNRYRHACLCKECFDSIILTEANDNKPRCPLCREEITEHGSVSLNEPHGLKLNYDYVLSSTF